MIGAIAGDIIGSVYEYDPIKTKAFPLISEGCRFTDDSVLTIAIAHAILSGDTYQDAVRRFGQRYPDAGYGRSFAGWLSSSDPRPYDSWGNGAAMRVSAIGFAFDEEQRVLQEAEASARFTHDHPEGIRGAQATALAVFLARRGHSRAEIRARIEHRFGYALDRTLDEIRPGYRYEISCQRTVPEAIIAFLEADSVEDAIRNAISLGGDSDTLACIAGGIAEAWYQGVTGELRRIVASHLPPELLDVAERFQHRFRD